MGEEKKSENISVSEGTTGGMNPVELSCQRGSTVYTVEISEDSIGAEEAHYPLPGYGNSYGIGWIINLKARKKYAEVRKYRWNYGYATAGHGMTDSWEEGRGYMKMKEAREFLEDIKDQLPAIENKTPDVIELAKIIIKKVEDVLSEEGE